MKERLQTGLRNLLDKWRNLTKYQKYWLLGLAASVVIALIISMFFLFRTNWTSIGVAPDMATAGQIQAILDEAGINNNVDQGHIMVPEGDLFAAQALIASSPLTMGLQDMFHFSFQDAIDFSGMGVTSAMQHEMFVQTRQGELSQVLTHFAGIAQARVTLNMPNTGNILAALSPPPSASVVITPYMTLPSDIGETIAHFVAAAVPSLTTENIIITDTNGPRTLWPVSADDGAALFDTRMQFVQFVRSIAEQGAQNVLEPMFETVNVTANIVANFDEVTQQMREVTSPLGPDDARGLLLRETTHDLEIIAEEMMEGGEPGLAPMIPGMMFGPEVSGITTMVQADRDTEFVHNVIDTLFTQGIGAILPDQSGIAVTATISESIYEADLQALGLLDDMTFLEFQQDIETQTLIFNDMTEAATALISAATGIPNVEFFLIQFTHFVAMDEEPFELAPILLFVLVFIFLGLLAFGLIRRTSPEVISEVEPELSVEDLLVSSQLDEEMEAAAGLASITTAQDSQVKEHLDKFAQEMPESVAQLLRNWLNEDWE